MLPPNQNWPCRVIFILLVSFSLAACASYPDDPRAPITGDDTYAVTEDDPITISKSEGILANDSAREGTTITLVTVGEIDTDGGGIINLASDGSFTYEPSSNFNGTDQAVYTIRNKKGKSSEGTITFNVTPLNDAPEPVSDEFVIQEGQSITANVLENDLDPDGDVLTVTEYDASVCLDDSGQYFCNIQLDTDGTLTFDPLNHTGEIQFFYMVSDENDAQWAGWVFITIENIDAGIEVLPDTLTVLEGGDPVTISFDEVLANDQDLESDNPLSVIALGEAQYGSVVNNGDNTFTYTPPEDYSGEDSFTYTVQSQSGSTASATVTVIITEVEDPPAISDIDDVTIEQGQSTDWIEFTLSDPDTSLEDLIVSADVTDASPANLIPQDGIVLASGEGETRFLRITPDADLNGEATITVTVADGQAETSVSFILTVTPLNNAPTISSIEDQSININELLSLTISISDDESAPATLTLTGSSDNQTLVPDTNIVLTGMGSSRTLVIVPAAGQTGTAVITLIVSDEDGQTAQTSFELTVTDPTVNTAPTISSIEDQIISVNTFLQLVVTISDNESASSELTLTAVSDNQVLISDTNIVLTGSGALRVIGITPVTGQTGTALITVTVSDGELSADSFFQVDVIDDDSTAGSADG